LVWGQRAALHLEPTLIADPAPDPNDLPAWRDAGTELPDPALITQDMSSVKHIMWNYVGLVRTAPRLERALHELRNLESEIEQFYRKTRVTDGLIGLRNAVRTAVIVTMAAWENKSSLGCHYRE
jgi:L-aspartate oxidase